MNLFLLGRTLPLLGVFAFTPLTAARAEIPLLIFAGQSNMVGFRTNPSFSTGGKTRLFSGVGSPRTRINTGGMVPKVVVEKTRPLHKAVYVTMIGSRYVFTKHAAVEGW